MDTKVIEAANKQIDKIEDDEDLQLDAMKMANYVEKSFDLNNLQNESGFGVWQKEISAQIDKQTLKNLFLTDDWVFILVDLVSNKLSSIELQIMSQKVVDGERSIDEIVDHPLNIVFARPNEFQDYHSWMYNQGVEDTLMGNDIMWWNKKDRQFMILPADQVNISFAEDGSLDQYMVSTLSQDESGFTQMQNKMLFDAKDIVHIRRPNPKSLLWGLSPFLPGKSQLLFNRYTADYLNAFYLKQATPGIALEMDRDVKEDVALKQLKSFEQAYTGRTNQRRSLILPKGVKAKPLSHSLADQRIVEMIDKNRETILALLKIPKHEVGLQKSGSLGSEEHKIALRNFWEATMIPMQKRIAGSLTIFFQKRGELEPNEFIQFDNTDVPALQDDENKKAETAEKMAQTLTMNEVRSRVWDEEPLASPLAELPLSMMDKAQPPLEDNKPEEEDLEIEGEEELIEDKALHIMCDKAGFSLDLYIKEFEDQTAKSMNSYLDNSIQMIGDMAEIASNVVKRMSKATEEQEARLARMRAELADEFGELEDQFVKDHNNSLTATVEVGYDQQLKFVFNQPNIDAVVALKTRTLEKERAVLEARGIESFANISKTQSKRMLNEIRKGVEKGESVGQIQSRIANTFKNPEAMIRRAATIARTETLFAVSQGQWAATKNAAEVIPGLKKVWLNVNRNPIAAVSRVRGHPGDSSHKAGDPDHWNLHRVVRDVKKEFPNELLYPRDPNGEAGDVINCRCTWLMLPPDQEIPDTEVEGV